MKILFFLFFIILNIKSTLSFVDFFLNSNETQTLLGYSGSLYYIYYGDLRAKTQSQVLNINNNKTKIQYSWKSYQRKVNYKIDLHEQTNNNLDLSLDIPSTGDVPTELSNFNLKVTCIDTKSIKNNDFRIKILFNSKNSFNKVELNLNYLKICENDLKQPPKAIKTDFTVAFSILMIIFVAFILVLVFTILRQHLKLKNKKFNIRYYYKIFRGSKQPLLTTTTATTPSINIVNNRIIEEGNYSKLITNSSKLKQQINRNESSNQNIYETLKDLTCVSATLNQTSVTTITQNNNAELVASKPTTGLRAKKRESRFKVNCSQIKIGDLLLEGTFGRVFEGFLTKKVHKNEEEDEESATDAANSETCVVKVFIKTVSELTSTKQADLMVSEASVLKYVKHKHVNSLLGLCFDSSSPLALFKYCENGNLKNYLKNQQHNLTIQELLYMTLQLCKAVNFIHLKRIIHKDISARNCWIDKNLFIKLSDGALSRDIFPLDYHCLGDNENRPIMWLAFESICENKYSIESDIWSLAVTFWEILSFAKQPYEDIDPFDMETYLVHDRNRLQKPTKCPLELHQIYAKCWRLDADTRPTLKDLFNSMLEFYSTLGNYV